MVCNFSRYCTAHVFYWSFKKTYYFSLISVNLLLKKPICNFNHADSPLIASTRYFKMLLFRDFYYILKQTYKKYQCKIVQKFKKRRKRKFNIKYLSFLKQYGKTIVLLLIYNLYYFCIYICIMYLIYFHYILSDIVNIWLIFFLFAILKNFLYHDFSFL